MKILLDSSFFFLLLAQLCLAQWHQQNSGTSKNLYAIQFIDANNGFAVGDSGIILRTTNAGNVWLSQPSETNLPLNDIFFADSKNGWTSGGYANTGQVFWAKEIVLKTTDAGITWYKQFEDSADCPLSIFFVDTLNGWCAGYKIRKTTDGGGNWLEVIGFGWDDWSEVYFKNLDTGIVVGTRFGEGRGAWPSTISTTDGWLNFHYGTPPVGPYLFGGMNGACFYNSNRVAVVGRAHDHYNYIDYGIISKTTDWGVTWATELIEGPSFNDVCFTDEDNGWIAGTNRILRTTDGGATWNTQLSDTVNVFNSLSFTDVSNGWIVGNKGAIFHTTNGGISFVDEEKVDEMPTEFLLSQNYPNPFNPSTSIHYVVSNKQFVSLKVYDVLGNGIETLVNEERQSGIYKIAWYAENLPSGVYFYQLKIGKYTETKKMLLLR